MSEKRYSAVLFLAVIVPLLVSTIILIIIVMVVPNSGGERHSEQSAGSDTPSSSQQVPSASLSPQTRSHILFILGIIFATSLFALLIVIIILVCTWARRAKGYAVNGQEFGGVTNHQQRQDTTARDTKLKKQHGKESLYAKVSKPPGKAKKGGSVVKPQTTLSTPPTPPFKTVAITTQVSAKNSFEKTGDFCPSFDSVNRHRESDTCPPPVPPKNYGTLGRTHLLSTADEDGYYVDNLGYEPDEEEEEDTDEVIQRPSSNRRSLTTLYEDGFPKVPQETEESDDKSKDVETLVYSSVENKSKNVKLPSYSSTEGKSEDIKTDPYSSVENKRENIKTPSNSLAAEDKSEDVKTPPYSSVEDKNNTKTPSNSLATEDKSEDVKTPPYSRLEDKRENIKTPSDSSVAEGDVSEPSEEHKHPDKILSKQDSFQGLPPFESFDKYLRLVRLDSSASLGSVEDSKKVWKSIEEEEEEEEEKREISEVSRKE